MKKQKKLSRTIAWLVVCVIILAACGSPAAPAAPTSPAETAPGGEASQVEEITIGMLAPLTGPVAHFGESVRDGAMLYIEQFNARGGLQINVIQFNEEGDPVLATTGYNHLVDQGVTAIIGSVTSGPTMAVVPLAFEDGMPMITASSTHANVTVNATTGAVFTNMFRSCFIDPFQGVKMADFAVDVAGASTAAILFSNEIDYSIGLTESFRARAEERGLEIVAVETFADAAIDLSGQLTNIAAQNPDVMFFPAYIRHVALMGPQSVQVGLDTVMLGADGWNGALEAMEDPSSVDGSFFITGFTEDSDDPRVQNFIANYVAKTGFSPNMFAAQAYDAAAILIAALEAALADGLEPGSAEFKAAVIGHMSATNMTGVTGHITFDEFNNPQKTAFIVTVEDGAEKFWGTF